MILSDVVKCNMSYERKQKLNMKIPISKEWNYSLNSGVRYCIFIFIYIYLRRTAVD